MADITNNNSSNSGGFFNSNWSYLLPLALGAASMLSPRIGQGAGTMLQGFDWLRKGQQEQRRLSSLQNVGNVISQSAAGGQYPGMDKMIAAAGGDLDAALPLISRMAELGRPQLVHLPGGGLAQANQTPAGEMKLSDLRPGQQTPQDFARAQLVAEGNANPDTPAIYERMKKNELSFSGEKQQQHIAGQVQMGREMLPIQTQHAQTAADIQAAKTRELLPAQTAAHKDIVKYTQDVKDEAEMKPGAPLLTSIAKQIEETDNKLALGMGAGMQPLTNDEKKALMAKRDDLMEFHTETLAKIRAKMKLEPKTQAQPAASPSPSSPGKEKPTAGDLADYRTVMRDGSPKTKQAAQSKALMMWGYLP